MELLPRAALQVGADEELDRRAGVQPLSEDGDVFGGAAEEDEPADTDLQRGVDGVELGFEPARSIPPDGGIEKLGGVVHDGVSLPSILGPRAPVAAGTLAVRRSMNK